MADASSTSNARSFTQEQLAKSTSPSPSLSTSSSSSSSSFQETPDEVPQEYLMASPSSALPFTGQDFPFPPQQTISGIPVNPLSGFIRPQEYYMMRFQGEYDNQAPHAEKEVPSSSSKPPVFDQHSSSARLVHEQRLSTCLNILRHIQRTLRQRHQEATMTLTRIQSLEVQTTWELFFQSPLDFMCHEMDILTDAATRAILSEGDDFAQRHSLGDSEAWMMKLDGLRDLRDDGRDAKERLRKISERMRSAEAIMRVGLREQVKALERNDPMASHYRRAFNQGHHEADAMTSSKGKASAALSTFFNWPLPTTSLNDDETDVDTGDDSSSESSGQCISECCRDHSS